MNLQQLQALSDSIKDGRQFLAHPLTREIWWGIVEPGHKSSHRFADIGWLDGEGPDQSEKRFCTICRKWFPAGQVAGCVEIDPVPGSLADAVEKLRETVVSKRKKGAARRAALLVSGKSPSCVDAWLAFASPRDWFVTFAAAAGGVEMGGETR